jgi:hypothetical protein
MSDYWKDRSFFEKRMLLDGGRMEDMMWGDMMWGMRPGHMLHFDHPLIKFADKNIDLLRLRGDRVDVIHLRMTPSDLISLMLYENYSTEEQIDHLFAFGSTAKYLATRPDDMEWDDDCDDSLKDLPLSEVECFVESFASDMFVARGGRWFKVKSLDDDGTEIDGKYEQSRPQRLTFDPRYGYGGIE